MEADPPPGTLAVQLHAYQKRFLSWAVGRERAFQCVKDLPGKGNRISGGLLADEQVNSSQELSIA